MAHPWCLLSVVGLEEYSAQDWRAATWVQRAPVTLRGWGLWLQQLDINYTYHFTSLSAFAGASVETLPLDRCAITAIAEMLFVLPEGSQPQVSSLVAQLRGAKPC